MKKNETLKVIDSGNAKVTVIEARSRVGPFFLRFLGVLFVILGLLLLIVAPFIGGPVVALGVLFITKMASAAKKPKIVSIESIDTPRYTGGPTPEPMASLVPFGHAFDVWDSSIHGADGQDLRFDRALFQNLIVRSFDEGNGCAVIQGSKGDFYTTTFRNCSCKDFQRRGLPCKHMYKLALLAGFSADTFFACRDDVVWHVERGRTYHKKPNCKRMRSKFPRRSTVAMIEANGFRPCSECYRNQVRG